MSEPMTPTRPRSRALAHSRVLGALLTALALGLRIARVGDATVLALVVGALLALFGALFTWIVLRVRRNVARARAAHPGALAVTNTVLRVRAPAADTPRRRTRPLPMTATLLTDRVLLEPTSRSGKDASIDVPLESVARAAWGRDFAGSRAIATLELSRRYGAGPDVVLRLDRFGAARDTRAFAVAIQMALVSWLPPGERPAAVPETLRTGRSGMLALAGSLLSLALAVVVGYAGGHVATARARTRHLTSPSRTAGVPGYYTMGGPRHLPLQVGAPWGVRCMPVVIQAGSSLPDAEYAVLAEVVREAHDKGLDVTIADRDQRYDVRALYHAPGPLAGPEYVPVFADRGAQTAAAPHETEGWDAALDRDGKHEYLTSMSQHVHLEAVEGHPEVMRKTSLRLLGLTQGVLLSTSDHSAFGADFDSAPATLSAQDVHAMLTMSGCAGAAAARR